MSLSHCIDKAQNEIRRHKILLQKEKKPDEALAYEKEQSAALKELKSMLDLQALDGEENKGKAIAKLKSVIESLSLDRDEVVIQIEAKGGKVETPSIIDFTEEPAQAKVPVVPSGQGIFVDRITGEEVHVTDAQRDFLKTASEKEQENIAAGNSVGQFKIFGFDGSTFLAITQPNSSQWMVAKFEDDGRLTGAKDGRHNGLMGFAFDDRRVDVVQKKDYDKAKAQEAKIAANSKEIADEEAKPTWYEYKGVISTFPRSLIKKSGRWYRIGTDDKLLLVGRRSGDASLLDSISNNGREWVPSKQVNVSPDGRVMFDRDAKPAEDVPDAVKDRVRYALNKLQDVESAMKSVERARGRGHIYNLEWQDQQKNISSANDTLDEFRTRAEAKGIDADAVIKSLGGMPDMAAIAPTPSSIEGTNELTGNRRNPLTVNIFKPYMDGDIVSIGGKDWQIKNDGGWYLTTTGNWRGEHPEIKKIPAMVDLIRAIEQASVAKPEEQKSITTKSLEDDLVRAINDRIDSMRNGEPASKTMREVESTDYAIGQALQEHEALKGRRENPEYYKAFVEAKNGLDYGNIRERVIGSREIPTFVEDANQAADAELERRILIAADSIDKLRKVDVERVLMQGNIDRKQMADYIKRKRPEFSAEVDSVIEDATVEDNQKSEALDREMAGFTGVNDAEYELRQLSRKEKRDGDIELGNGKFVTLEQAVAAAKRSMDPADWIKPFQFNRQLDIAPIDWNTMVGAMKNATVDAKKQEEAGPPEPASEMDALKAEMGQAIVEQHSATIAKMFEGELSIDEFKAAFALVRDNRESIEAELSKLKKDALLKMGGANFAYRYKTETKPVIIRGLYGDMLGDFTLNKTLSYFVGGNMADAKNKAIQKIVDESTQADMDAFGERVKERRAENEKRAEEIKSAVNDPKTLDDFRLYLRAEMAKGKTDKEARMTMTPEQRAAYDNLAAEYSRKLRADRKETANTNITAAAVTTAGQLFETKHTKTGEDLFVVKTADRVERDVYNLWNATAKKLGGYYSSYRGNGAIPGFTFKEKDNALAFMQFVGGDAVAAQEAVKEERNAYADDKAQSAVERLTEMADRLDERADESLGQERKANTSRRARFAASAEAAASSDKALAKTMRNIANAISEGSAKFLDKVRQKSQVEMLRSTIGQAKYQELITKYTSYANQEQHKGEPATAETADFARWPQFTAMRSDLASLGRDLLQIDGAKLLGKQLLKVADDVSDAYTKFAKENLHKVSTFSTSDGKPAIFGTEDKALEAINRSGYKGKAAVVSFKRGEHMVVMGPEMAKEKGLWTGDTDKRITLTPEFGEEIVAKNKAFGKRNRISMPYIFDNVSQERARWKALGIESPAEMRAALREFVGLQERPAEADKIKQMERAMIGRKNDGLDFFPTPANTAQDMIDAAEIEPGMSVLEPSAGMGHIAEQIREAGVDPDVIEYGYDRRELLEAKGFRVVGNDFMEMSPRGFTFGDIFKDQDGNLGVMRGGGGLGSNRVGFQPLDASGQPDARTSKWVDRDELTGVEKRAGDSGYDRIIMNPPFSDRRDAEHVQHAFTLLKPGGRIVAIMGEGVFFGQDAKAKAFREWLEKVGGTSEKLEEGTFLDPSLPVNTGANARLVVIDKPAGSVESDEVNQSNPYGSYHAKAVEFNNAPESDRVFQFGNGAGLGSVRRRGLSRQFGSIANGAPSKAYSTGVADFRGTSINGPEDLADIAQIYRNPSYETMRYFFVKNGAIVSQNAVSSRLPGSSNIFFGKSDAEKASWANQIAIEAKALGADGVYLLHNHPNGDPSASNEDMAATQTIIGMIEPHGIRVLDHVIINHNKYGVIETVQRNGQEELDWRVVNKDYNADEQYSFANPKQAHPVIGALVYGPKNVAIAAKQAQVSPGQVVIVGTAGSNGVRLLAEVTPAQITNPKITIATIRRLSKQSGAAHLYAYGMPISATNSLAEMIRRGIFIDAIVVDESGVEWSVAGITGAHPKKGWHFGIESSGSEVEMTAWHGSPHDHDKFDSSKIGTGEGAQAYGWGHYFASAKDVAVWYRDKLSTAAGGLDAHIRAIHKSLGSDGAATKAWFAEKLSGENKYSASDKREIKRLVNSKKTLEELYPPTGKLYQVELAPSEDEYLDWDKPLSEQSELVRDALTDKSHWLGEYFADTLESARENGARFDETGETLYKIATDQYGSDKAASDYLHSIGIRGIRYLDGSSRGTPNHSFSVGGVTATGNNQKWSVKPLIGGLESIGFSNDVSKTAISYLNDSRNTNDPLANAILGAEMDFKTGDVGSEVSEALKKISYVGTNPNHNYVIFSDDDVSITAKFAKDAKRTNETPESIRSALVERFGAKGIAALEKSGMLKIMSINDAPSAILETAIEQNASALYTIDGVAYLFSDRMTAQDAPGKLLHELGEHHGLATMLGDSGFKALTKRLVNMAKANGSIAAKAWEGVKTKYGEFNGKSFADLSGNERFIHEVLAAIGENKEGQKTSIWRELLAKIKSWLASKGLASDWLNEGDIVNLVNGSLKKIMREAEYGLVAPQTMAAIITDHFKQIVESMKADNKLIEECA